MRTTAADALRAVQQAERHRDSAHRCQHAAAQHASAARRPGATLAELEACARAARGWACEAWRQAASARAAADEIDAAPRRAVAAAHEAAGAAHRFACEAEQQLIGALAATRDRAELAQASARLARSAVTVALLEARAAQQPGLLAEHAARHLSRMRRHHRVALVDAGNAGSAAACARMALETAHRALHGEIEQPAAHRQALRALVTQLGGAATAAESSMRQARQASDRAARVASNAQLGMQVRLIGHRAAQYCGVVVHLPAP
jgi:hypothetical protein